ncbi:MAG TPA: hypothetical protein VHI50_06230, partial [Micromonosporaceae bacterium]|nr:hypothetical protein [Micromonosporaceae bacterium]
MERLLSRRHMGPVAGGPPADARLDRRHSGLEALLAAAAAPGRPHELAGEQAALAAFRAAGLTGPLRRGAPPEAPARAGATARRLVVVQAVAAVTVAVGGVALAAGAGVAPGLVPRPLDAPAPAPARPESAAASAEAAQSAPPTRTPQPPVVTVYPPLPTSLVEHLPQAATPAQANGSTPPAPQTPPAPEPPAAKTAGPPTPAHPTPAHS